MRWQADTNINALRHYISWSALQQHVLISENSRVSKSYFLTKEYWSLQSIFPEL